MCVPGSRLPPVSFYRYRYSTGLLRFVCAAEAFRFALALPTMLSLPPSSGHWVYDPSNFRGGNWLEHYSSNILEVYSKISDASLTHTHSLSLTKNLATNISHPENSWGPYRYLCSARLGGTDLPRATEGAKWRWAQGDTLMQVLDREKMATIIRDTPIRFVGDSLIQEMFSSMVGLLGQDIMVEGTWAANGTIVVPLRRGGRIRYERIKQVVEHMVTHTDIPDAPDYPVLVLDSTMPRGETGCNATSDLGRAVSKLSRGVLVVYVAFDPTHPACSHGSMQSAYSQPTRTKPAIATFSITQLYDYNRWCWGKIPEHTYNDIQTMRPSLGNRLVVLNLTDATGQRPDSHSVKIPTSPQTSRCCDCMHHCLPGGPIETWNDALFAALTQRAAGKKITSAEV